jgi:hypothetical protein
MRITKSKLRQIIREELARVNEQDDQDAAGGTYGDSSPESEDYGEPGVYRGGFSGLALKSPRGDWYYRLPDTDEEGRGNVVGNIEIMRHPGDKSVSKKNPIVLKPGHPEYNATRSKLSAMIQSGNQIGKTSRDPHPSIPDSTTAGIERDAEKAGLRDRRP